MNKKKSSQSIKQCRDKAQTEFDSYYQTVIISVGLKHIFDSNEPCTFKVNEPSMKTNFNTVTPDAIFQCDNDTKGIVCEIKTSLPENEEHLLKDMKDQIEKYSKIVSGWKTENGTIDQYSILLVIHRTESKKLDKLVKQWIKNGDIVTNKNICISDWQSIRPFKIAAKDTILLSHRSGTTKCNYFDKRLQEDIKIDADSLVLEYENRKFVKSTPPNLYVMTILYQNIFPIFANDDDEFTVTIDDLMKPLTEYYTSWSGLEGEQSQIRRSWVNSAMDEFSRIQVAEKTGKKNFSYTIKWSKNLPKDVTGYLLDKLCGKDENIVTDAKQARLS